MGLVLNNKDQRRFFTSTHPGRTLSTTGGRGKSAEMIVRKQEKQGG